MQDCRSTVTSMDVGDASACTHDTLRLSHRAGPGDRGMKLRAWFIVGAAMSALSMATATLAQPRPATRTTDARHGADDAGRRPRGDAWDAWGEARARATAVTRFVQDETGAYLDPGSWWSTRLVTGTRYLPTKNIKLELEVERLNGYALGGHDEPGHQRNRSAVPCRARRPERSRTGVASQCVCGMGDPGRASDGGCTIAHVGRGHARQRRRGRPSVRRRLARQRGGTGGFRNSSPPGVAASQDAGVCRGIRRRRLRVARRQRFGLRR